MNLSLLLVWHPTESKLIELKKRKHFDLKNPTLSTPVKNVLPDSISKLFSAKFLTKGNQIKKKVFEIEMCKSTNWSSTNFLGINSNYWNKTESVSQKYPNSESDLFFNWYYIAWRRAQIIELFNTSICISTSRKSSWNDVGQYIEKHTDLRHTHISSRNICFNLLYSKLTYRFPFLGKNHLDHSQLMISVILSDKGRQKWLFPFKSRQLMVSKTFRCYWYLINLYSIDLIKILGGTNDAKFFLSLQIST